MKATDFMIGDWVFAPSSNPVKIISLGNTIGLDLTHHYRNLQPIPLTPEILEKNGFTKGRKGESWQYMTIGNYIAWGKGKNSDVNRLNMRIGDSPKNVACVDCQYVHELQHALRLCGIDKEIVL